MPDDPNTALGKIMDQAWNETMTEAAQELPDEFQHLGEKTSEIVSNDKKAEENTQSTPSIDENLEAEKPIEEAAAKPEEGTPPKVETAEAPQHWSAEDRATFAKLDEEGRKFLLRRHREMEADYTRKTQERERTVKLGKPFQEYLDSGLGDQLARNGVTSDAFLTQLIAFHRLSVENPVEFIRITAQNLGINPAEVLNPKPTGEEGKPADPVSQRIVAIEQRLAGEDERRTKAANEAAVAATTQFKEAKTETGEQLHPHFEKVRATMGRLMLADPSLDMEEAYKVAVFRDPELRPTAIATAAAPAVSPAQVAPVIDARKVKDAEAAMAAKRSNIRSGASVNASRQGADGKPLTVRQAMAAAADEIGMK